MEIGRSVSGTNEILSFFSCCCYEILQQKELKALLLVTSFNSFSLGLSGDLCPEIGGAFSEATLTWILLCDN